MKKNGGTPNNCKLGSSFVSGFTVDLSEFSITTATTNSCVRQAQEVEQQEQHEKPEPSSSVEAAFVAKSSSSLLSLSSLSPSSSYSFRLLQTKQIEQNMKLQDWIQTEQLFNQIQQTTIQLQQCQQQRIGWKRIKGMMLS